MDVAAVVPFPVYVGGPVDVLSMVVVFSGIALTVGGVFASSVLAARRRRTRFQRLERERLAQLSREDAEAWARLKNRARS